MEQSKYDVFISYSRKDYVDEKKNVIPGNVVSKIKDALTGAGITYWFDEEGIYSGQNFVEKIVTNIENAKIFIFLSTANANNSPWTCKEIASADEFKKPIIPVRIDSTPYNKKVLFRIADLDFIEYYTNPQKGIDDLIKAIKSHLEAMAQEAFRLMMEEKKKKDQERKKEEELKLQKELDAKRRQEEQQQLVSDINLESTALNNEETKLALDRETLLLKTEKVSDAKQRAALIDQIRNGGAIHKEYQNKIKNLLEQIKKLKEQLLDLASTKNSLEEELKGKDDKIKQLEYDLVVSRQGESLLKGQLDETLIKNRDLEKQIIKLNSYKQNTQKTNRSREIAFFKLFCFIVITALVANLAIYNLVRSCNSSQTELIVPETEETSAAPTNEGNMPALSVENRIQDSSEVSVEVGGSAPEVDKDAILEAEGKAEAAETRALRDMQVERRKIILQLVNQKKLAEIRKRWSDVITVQEMNAIEAVLNMNLYNGVTRKKVESFLKGKRFNSFDEIKQAQLEILEIIKER